MQKKDKVMSDNEIGDLLDLEKEYTYPCSDGSYTTTIDCHKVVQSQAKISFREARIATCKEVGKWLSKKAKKQNEMMLVQNGDAVAFRDEIQALLQGKTPKR